MKLDILILVILHQNCSTFGNTLLFIWLDIINCTQFPQLTNLLLDSCNNISYSFYLDEILKPFTWICF